MNNQNGKSQLQPHLDLKLTTAMPNEDGSHVFGEGVIFRKVSKFVIQSTEDGVVPIPVFYDPKTGKIMLETLPKELREEYKTYNDSL